MWSTVASTVGDEPRRHVLLPELGGQPLDVQPFGLRNLLGRVEGGQHHFVRDRERVGELRLEDVAPAARRPRLERRDQLAGTEAALEGEHRLADRRRVVGKIVDHGHARGRRRAPLAGGGPRGTGAPARAMMGSSTPSADATATTPIRFSWL